MTTFVSITFILFLISSVWIRNVCGGTDKIHEIGEMDYDSVQTADVVQNTVKKTNIFHWDSKEETASEFQGRFCNHRCNGTKRINRVDGDRCLQCFPCTCDSFCAIEGTCCPQTNSSWFPPPVERAQCKPQFGQSNEEILHVVACDQGFPSGKTRSMCESKSSFRRRDTLLPVTSLITNVTYANIYCAACNHDDKNLTEWKITCLHNQYLYNVTNDTQYDERAIQMPEICGFSTSDAIESNRYHRCNPSLASDGVITSCSVTQTDLAEANHDEHVRQACETSGWSRGAMVSVARTRVYSNMFCALCNGEQHDMMGYCSISFSTRMHFDEEIYAIAPRIRGTSMLIEINRDITYSNTVTLGGCPDGKWQHPQGECRDLECSAGKQLDDEGRNCSTSVSRVRGLGYTLKLLLVPIMLFHVENNSSTTTTTTTAATSHHFSFNSFEQVPQYGTVSVVDGNCDYGVMLKQQMDEVVGIVSDDVSLSANITTAPTPDGDCFAKTYQSQLAKLMQHVNVTRSASNKTLAGMLELDIAENAEDEAKFLAAKIEVHLIAPKSMERDSFEKDMLSLTLNREWTIHFHGWMVRLKPLDMSTELQEAKAQPTSDFPVFGVNQTDKIDFPYEPSVRNLDVSNLLAGLEHLYLPLSNHLLCPFLSFEKDEFELKDLGDDGGVQVEFPFYLDSDMKLVSFNARHYSNMAWLTKRSQLIMCSNAFPDIFPSNVTVVSRRGQGTSMVRQVMSAVCGSISVVCLVLTLITYALFRQLRALPGLNNVGLSGTLATAQLSLLIPWHRTDNNNVCRAVGIFTHWAWLMALSWMGVCCLHMVRVFTSKTRHTRNEHEVKRAFLRNIILTVSLSTGIVVMTITVTSAVSGGFSMGYGGSICFLDTEFHPLLILAFMLPLGLVIITNLACFTFTVVAIARVRRLQAQTPRERRDVLVYAKLVTVTGGTWVLGFFAELANEEWMRVLAELCTAVQGLLLFLAYVCNVRVWRLYRARFGTFVPESVSTSATAVTSSQTTKPSEV